MGVDREGAAVGLGAGERVGDGCAELGAGVGLPDSGFGVRVGEGVIGVVGVGAGLAVVEAEGSGVADGVVDARVVDAAVGSRKGAASSVAGRPERAVADSAGDGVTGSCGAFGYTTSKPFKAASAVNPVWRRISPASSPSPCSTTSSGRGCDPAAASSRTACPSTASSRCSCVRAIALGTAMTRRAPSASGLTFGRVRRTGWGGFGAGVGEVLGAGDGLGRTVALGAGGSAAADGELDGTTGATGRSVWVTAAHPPSNIAPAAHSASHEERWRILTPGLATQT